MMAHSQNRQKAKSGKMKSERNVVHELMKLINEFDEGEIKLSTLGHFLPSVTLETMWNAFIENQNCFVVDHPWKRFSEIDAQNERVFVKSPIGLCPAYIRKRKDLDCGQECQDLHICRSFLLCSENSCPFFNSKKRNCKFGHSFETKQNRTLLNKFGLGDWSDEELRRLFRRRLSRRKSTLPQICFYYNKADGKKCTNERCRSLHICEAFIEGECSGNCRKNHQFESKQTKFVLDQFAIDLDGEWTGNQLKEDLMTFMQKRNRTVSGTSSGTDVESDDDELDGATPHATQSSDQFVPSSQHTAGVPSDQMQFSSRDDKCSGCRILYNIAMKNKVEIFELKRQVAEMQQMLREMRDAKQ